MRRIRSHLTFANAMSLVAVFVALGGAAYAVNTVRSSDIVNGEVKTPDLAADVAATRVRITTPTGAQNLAAQGGANTAVATLTNLPKGKYLLVGEVTAINFGTYDIVRCNIRAGGQSYPGSAVQIGQNTAVTGVNAVAAGDFGSAFTATLECSHDFPVSGIYVESRSLRAVPLKGLVAQST